MFYYFGGYLGYVILGYYLHHYNRLSRMNSVLIGAILFIVGTVVTYWGFISDQQAFLDKLAATNVEEWKGLEFNINFLSPNVVIMTAGVFMMFQNMQFSCIKQRIIRELSILSYGIFLVHYIICLWLGFWLPGVMGMNPGLEQYIIAVLTFFISYGIVKILSFLPGSKYIIG